MNKGLFIGLIAVIAIITIYVSYKYYKASQLDYVAVPNRGNANNVRYFNPPQTQTGQSYL